MPSDCRHRTGNDVVTGVEEPLRATHLRFDAALDCSRTPGTSFSIGAPAVQLPPVDLPAGMVMV